MNNTDQKTEKTPIRTAIKLIIVAVILIILVFLSIAIVKVVPKAINSLASASLSIGDVFSGSNDAENTGEKDNKSPSSNSTGSSSTNASGASDGNASSTVNRNSTGGFSIRDLVNSNSSSTPNYVPAPAPLPGTKPKTISSTNNSNGNVNNNVPETKSKTDESGQQSNPNYKTVGQSDIAVEIIAKGIIDKNTGRFVETNSFATNDMVVVKFKVENRGLFATGAWSARVDMPSYNANDKVRTLGPIGSINAGSAITGEARFDQPIAGTQTITIAVDTQSSTSDTNRANNIATHQIYTSGSNNNSNVGGVGYNPGAADLRATIIQTGTVNVFGQFIPNTSPRYGTGEKIGIRFEVANIGGTATPTWSWRADLSGSTYNTYTTTENPLAPGAVTRLIVGFDTVNYGQSNMTITVDSSNVVYEQNESNNTVSQSVSVSY